MQLCEVLEAQELINELSLLKHKEPRAIQIGYEIALLICEHYSLPKSELQKKIFPMIQDELGVTMYDLVDYRALYNKQNPEEMERFIKGEDTARNINRRNSRGKIKTESNIGGGLTANKNNSLSANKKTLLNTKNINFNDVEKLDEIINSISSKLDECANQLTSVWPALDSGCRILARSELINLCGSFLRILDSTREDE